MAAADFGIVELPEVMRGAMLDVKAVEDDARSNSRGHVRLGETVDDRSLGPDQVPELWTGSKVSRPRRRPIRRSQPLNSMNVAPAGVVRLEAGTDDDPSGTTLQPLDDFVGRRFPARDLLHHRNVRIRVFPREGAAVGFKE
jgi:hypothetical protein